MFPPKIGESSVWVILALQIAKGRESRVGGQELLLGVVVLVGQIERAGFSEGDICKEVVILREQLNGLCSPS